MVDGFFSEFEAHTAGFRACTDPPVLMLEVVISIVAGEGELRGVGRHREVRLNDIWKSWSKVESGGIGYRQYGDCGDKHRETHV